MSRFWRKVGASRLLARCVRASNGLSGVEGGCRATQGVCEIGRRAVQSPIWGRAQFGQLSNQKSKRQDIRSIDSDRARMQAGSEAMGTPMGHSLHGLSPHIGADGRHGGTATAWKSAKIGHFCCPNSGQPLLAVGDSIFIILIISIPCTRVNPRARRIILSRRRAKLYPCTCQVALLCTLSFEVQIYT